MFELIKKTMLAGVGIAAITADKVEQLAKEYIERGEITEKEGKELINQFKKKSEQARKDYDAKLEHTVQKILKKMNIVSKSDISRLERRIKAMEKKLGVGIKDK